MRITSKEIDQLIDAYRYILKGIEVTDWKSINPYIDPSKNKVYRIRLSLHNNDRIERAVSETILTNVGFITTVENMLESEGYFKESSLFCPKYNFEPLKISYKDRVYKFGSRTIKDVIFNDPATIVIWDDGTKTVVKAENEKYDPEKGLAMAIAKRALGNKGNYYNTFNRWLPKEEPKAVPVKKKKVSKTDKKTIAIAIKALSDMKEKYDLSDKQLKFRWREDL